MLAIKVLRMSRGMTQWDLTHRIGMSHGRYSMIERGLIAPTPEERALLAEALGAASSMLFRPAVQMMNEVAC